MKSLEVEIDQQRRMTESMVADMVSIYFCFQNQVI